MRSKYSHIENLKQNPGYNYLHRQAVSANNRSRYIPGIFIMEEIWKDIKGYEGLYQVSNKGKVKSLGNNKFHKQLILKTPTNSDGYCYVSLYKNGKVKYKRISRLVTQHFIPNPQNKEQVNHINGIKTDNRVENLEWCTQSENQLHGYKMGLNKGPIGNKNAIGEKHGNHKLTEKQVKEIRKKYGKIRNKTYEEIGKEYNIGRTVISGILNYKNWKYI